MVWFTRVTCIHPSLCLLIKYHTWYIAPTSAVSHNQLCALNLNELSVASLNFNYYSVKPFMMSKLYSCKLYNSISIFNLYYLAKFLVKGKGLFASTWVHLFVTMNWFYISGFRWSDTFNMKNQMEQLMKFGNKSRKSYPWLSSWLIVRKGWSGMIWIALVYVQTRLPLELYSHSSSNVGLYIKEAYGHSWSKLLAMTLTFHSYR